MAFTLQKSTAQRIVDTVKDVCGYDINFIDRDGVIFASTDSARIGEYHEVARKVIDTRQTIEVSSDDSYFGTLKGVNIPFLYNRDLVAVIGISGEPDEVRRYAVLAQKIASMLMREHEMDSLDYGRRNQIHFILHALFEDQGISHNLLRDFFAARNLSIEDHFRVITVKLDTRYNLSNLTMLENELYETFDRLPNALYTFNYPNEYWLMITDSAYRKNTPLLEKLADSYVGILDIGIGTSEVVTHIHHSYQASLIAARSGSSRKNLIRYEDLTLDILFGALPETSRNRYLERTIHELKEEDIRLLKVYFSSGLSLQATSEQLYLHKNTVQYKLNRIHRLTGFNPRDFQDAVVLYLALCLAPES